MNPQKPRRRVALPVILLLFIILIGILLYDSNTRIVTAEFELSYPNLPAAFDGFSIAFLSDIHAAEFGADNERLISMIGDVNPDIIVIGGDIIDRYEKPPLEKQLEIAETLIRGIMPIAPVYYITGNHEWDSGGIRQLFSLLEELGVGVLRNRYTILEAGGESIILAGTDDPNGPADMIKPEELMARIRAAEGDKFTVMLEHRNNNLSLYSGLGVELVLCGHAHGGIIRLPFTDGLIGPQREWFPTYTNGIYSMGGTNMAVSRGVGNHTGWPRFLNNPEIMVVVLRVEN